MPEPTQNGNGAGSAPLNEAARELVVQHLDEAQAVEKALITTLQAHIAMTPRGEYRRLLERHLSETRQQSGAIERRLEALGAGTGLVAAAYGLVQTAVGQALALAKGPVDLLRGADAQEKQLKNARDECATEALEIALYDALEAIAGSVGDRETAELAARHREQEERMLADLRAQIPALAGATVRSGARVARVESAARPNGGGGAGGDTPEPPIAGYDRLNAGQVVSRLKGLDAEGRRAVAAYERRRRARRSILDRIEALERQA